MSEEETALKTGLKLFACQVLVLGIAGAPALAQQSPSQGNAQRPPASAFPAPTPNDTLRSPEVSNGMVTFRIYAPDAKEVKVQAEGNYRLSINKGTKQEPHVVTVDVQRDPDTGKTKIFMTHMGGKEAQ